MKAFLLQNNLLLIFIWTGNFQVRLLQITVWILTLGMYCKLLMPLSKLCPNTLYSTSLSGLVNIMELAFPLREALPLHNSEWPFSKSVCSSLSPKSAALFCKTERQFDVCSSEQKFHCLSKASSVRGWLPGQKRPHAFEFTLSQT